MNLRPWMSRRFLLGLFAMAVLLTLLVAASARLLISEGELRDDITEDMVWLSSQGQYEAVRFSEALSNFRLGSVSPDDLRLRLDLLTSRLVILEQGEPRRQVDALGYIERLGVFRSVVNEAAIRLTELTPASVAEITALREAVLPVAHSMRDIANAALLARRDHDAGVRDHRRQSLLEILAILVATTVAGLFLAVVLFRDHRNMVHAEAALERERQVSRLHRNFISVVSHQFRTPIAIIDASAQRMIRRGPNMAQTEIAERAEKIRNACLRLTRLVESTLNAARLEDGEISFTPRPCDPARLLRTVCDNQPEADQGRVLLEIKDLPDWIEADPVLLEQAVQNIVSNGLKYSPADTPVHVAGQRIGEEIVIRVSDSGVGIPADEIALLFQRFFRARTAEGIPGTGIGLSFVAQILDLHSGTVEVKSTEGKGSTFILRFPYRKPQLADEPALAPHREVSV